MEFPPLVHAPAQPLDLESMDWFVLPRAISELAGRGRVKDAVKLSDVTLAPIEEIWLPVWWVEASVQGVDFAWHERIEEEPGPDVVIQGGPNPHWPPGRPKKRRRRRLAAGIRHGRQTRCLPARRGYAIEPKLEIRVGDLMPGSESELDPETTVVPDLPRAEVERRFENELQPALGSVSLNDVRLCFVPLFVQRYRFGEDPSVHWAVIDGHRGKLVAEDSPSLGSRIKQMF